MNSGGRVSDGVSAGDRMSPEQLSAAAMTLNVGVSLGLARQRALLAEVGALIGERDAARSLLREACWHYEGGDIHGVEWSSCTMCGAASLISVPFPERKHNAGCTAHLGAGPSTGGAAQ
jgi:hypothetical protein